MAGTTWLKIIGSMNSPSSASAGEPLRGSTTKDMVDHVTAGLLIGQSDCRAPGWPERLGGGLVGQRWGGHAQETAVGGSSTSSQNSGGGSTQARLTALIPPKSPLV